MIDARVLPTVNAVLNATSALLLLAGWRAIRRGNVALHKRCMLSALASSTLFLASYLTWHFAFHELSKQVRFQGQGPVRTVYFTILVSHTVLAVATLPLVATTLTFALRGRFDRHRRIARVTWPIWMYVSVTGVVVYWMLYHGGFR